MNYYDSRMQVIQKTLGTNLSPKRPMSDKLIDGLKKMFPQYLWISHYNHHLSNVVFNVYCDDSLVFTCEISDKQYNVLLLNFVENFILNEKLELLFKEI